MVKGTKPALLTESLKRTDAGLGTSATDLKALAGDADRMGQNLRAWLRTA